jgi:hypothetical protein
VPTRALLETGAACQVARWHRTSCPSRLGNWERLLGGELYAPLSRLDWATLLRRRFDVDVKHCLACGHRMNVRAVVTDAATIARLLGALRRAVVAHGSDAASLCTYPGEHVLEGARRGVV